MSYTSGRHRALFGPHKKVDPEIVEGCLVAVQGGVHKDKVAKVISICDRRDSVEVAITEGTEQIGPRVVLTPGQVRFIEEIHRAIHPGVAVSVDSCLAPRSNDPHREASLRNRPHLALVTQVDTSRQLFEVEYLRYINQGEHVDDDIIAWVPGGRMLRTGERRVLLAGQANVILSHGCIVRVDDCRCDGRVCKLLGPANYQKVGVNLKIMNIEEPILGSSLTLRSTMSIDSGEDLRGDFIQGISDDCVVVVSVTNEEILDITKADRHYKRKKALQETPRTMPANQLTARQVMARSSPHSNLLRVPSQCLTLVHAEVEARGRFCTCCLAEDDRDEKAPSFLDPPASSLVCKDPGCLEWDQATSDPMQAIRYLGTFLEEVYSEGIENMEEEE